MLERQADLSKNHPGSSHWVVWTLSYLETEGDQRFAITNCAFWDTDFKLVVMKQKTQKENLTSPFLPKGIQWKCLFRNRILAHLLEYFHLSLFELSLTDRKDPWKFCSLDSPLCSIISVLPNRNFLCHMFILSHFTCELPTFTLKSQTPASSSLLSKMACELNSNAFWVSYYGTPEHTFIK